jgi:hypothetical protein
METQSAKATTNESLESTANLKSLGEILISLADVYRFNLTNPAQDAYVLTVGHRTDKDLNNAYRAILRNNKFMPTPAELLEACGIMKVRRDGSRPE